MDKDDQRSFACKLANDAAHWFLKNELNIFVAGSPTRKQLIVYMFTLAREFYENNVLAFVGLSQFLGTDYNACMEQTDRCFDLHQFYEESRQLLHRLVPHCIDWFVQKLREAGGGFTEPMDTFITELYAADAHWTLKCKRLRARLTATLKQCFPGYTAGQKLPTSSSAVDMAVMFNTFIDVFKVAGSIPYDIAVFMLRHMNLLAANPNLVHLWQYEHNGVHVFHQIPPGSRVMDSHSGPNTAALIYGINPVETITIRNTVVDIANFTLIFLASSVFLDIDLPDSLLARHGIKQTGGI